MKDIWVAFLLDMEKSAVAVTSVTRKKVQLGKARLLQVPENLIVKRNDVQNERVAAAAADVRFVQSKAKRKS